MNLAGIFPPLTTPFAADESLALDRLRQNLERYNRTRLTGYVITGSTGEAVMLTPEETERLWAAAREAAAPGKILIAGTGAESTAETVGLTNRAAGLGYAAALVRTPHYYKSQMTPEVLAEYFVRVADASRIPILIYSVPQFTGITVEAPLASRLSRHENIIGIKDSSGDVQRAGEIVAATPQRFRTLVGSVSSLYAALAAGAAGGILALACVLPEECVEVYDAVRSGDSERAQKLQLALSAASATLVTRYGVAGLKYALDRQGYYGGPARRPLQPVGESAKKEIDAVLKTFARPAVPSVSS